MRFFRFAACAASLLASNLLVAEQAQKPAHEHAKRNEARNLIAGPSKRPHYVSRTPLVDQPPANGVVIYNGNQKQTKAFSASRDPGAPVHNLPPAVIAVVTSGSKSASARPIVVGISSSAADARPVVVDIASSGSSAQPVVVGIASAGFQSAGAVEPVAISVSPLPAKRPTYRPVALDAQ